MIELAPVLLARIQFAFNISFHILFPSITIGLAWILLLFRVQFTRTGDQGWEDAYLFWVKIFALSFALGVVSGITMSFQFGTNWPGFIERAGNIVGPLLGYEVLTAFFMEATFLGIMLFGKHRVSNRVHLLATTMVAIGTTLSAFWIVSLNSWMQTPQGHEVVDGTFYARDWWTVIFNPSFPYRFFHVFIASLLTSAFLVAGISAWRIKKDLDGPATHQVMKAAVVMAAVLVPVQILVGDLHGLNTFEHQPAKVAAMEGMWKTERGAGFIVAGYPDEERRETRFALKIPKVVSLILTHDANGEVPGLDDLVEEHPPVAPVFWSFRVMLAMGGLMLIASWWAAISVWRNGVVTGGALTMLSWMTFSGWVATLAGWYVTEIGRQPWIIYGLLYTDDVAADHASATLMGTLLGYGVLYLFLLASYIATLRFMSNKPARSLQRLHEYHIGDSGGGDK